MQDSSARAAEIFAEALATPRAERAALLEARCGLDAALRAELQALLEHHDQADGFLDPTRFTARARLFETLAANRRTRPPASIGQLATLVGSRIAGYTILEFLGRGGMGAVYRAEQDSPRRIVAIKLIQPGVLSPGTLRRFATEAEALGRLQHPGIAQIIEAGTAPLEPQGGEPTPFIAMEFIPGRPLTDYATERQCTPREIVGLMMQVCQAVHHAHQRGVIHRDLKPANILVSDDAPDSGADDLKPGADPLTPPSPFVASSPRRSVASPKVLDFGVARFSDTQATLLTLEGQFIGTLAYMSPEQVSGGKVDVDIRSDVYALGVILYQLLARKLPIDPGGRSVPDAMRAILEESPPRLGTFARDYRGDLETIVARALQKDRERRYPSAGDLAEDLRRYLAGDAIEARRDSTLYVVRKGLRRHRGLVATVSLALLALIGFASWASWQARLNRELAVAARLSEQQAIAARDQAGRAAERLGEELRQTSIEHGRALAINDNPGDAEKLIWRALVERPSSPAAYWGLCELYSRHPIVASLATQVPLVDVMARSPDGRWLAVGGQDPGPFEIWDLSQHRRTHVIDPQGGRLFDLAFDPTGRMLVAALETGVAPVWDAAGGQVRHTLCAGAGFVRTACFSPDGSIIATGGQDRIIRLWDAATGDLRCELPVQRDAILRLRFSPDGDVLASSGRDRTVRIWDARALRQHAAQPADRALDDAACLHTLTGHVDQPYALGFSHDGRLLASVSANQDRTVRVWDVDRGTSAAVLRVPMGATVSVDFSADGRTLYGGGWFAIYTWDVADNWRPGRLAGLPSHAIAVAPEDDLLIAGGSRGVNVWDTRVRPMETRLPADESASLAFSPDGRLLASGCATGAVRLRDPVDGHVLRTFPAPPGVRRDPRLLRVRALAFDPTGRRLISYSSDLTAHVWDVASGERVETIRDVDFASQQSLAFSPDGRTMAMARRGSGFTLVRIGPQRETVHLPKLGTQALSLCYSPDGTKIATTYRENHIRLWTSDGEPLATLDTRATPWGVAFSPDGAKLLVSTWLHDIEIWDMATLTRDARLEGHTATPWGIQFRPGSPDVFASHAGDGTVRLWSLAQRRNLATFAVFADQEATVAAFSNDGQRIAVLGSTGEIRIWNLAWLDACVRGNAPAWCDRLRAEPGFAVNDAAVHDWLARHAGR